ncbi:MULTISPECIES: hypothetical protein [Mycobacteriaceae]|uniref:Uncharacterized protein n=1 Tax=Mycolicibacterium parafortuitum TaxID=39692 RepID=A0ACC6MMK8_MYCPF|nr:MULTISPECIES: hypothetical protein [Mycobacteriaceae]MBX7451527.1 hypothetical protein [Mycolicibacterium aurantiacum]MDZ5088163.1 hypothetical protein [Mycolicibacterium parafortuitum]
MRESTGLPPRQTLLPAATPPCVVDAQKARRGAAGLLSVPAWPAHRRSPINSPEG